MMDSSTTLSAPEIAADPLKLQNLPHLLHTAEGFRDVLQALQRGRAATIDGAWKSSAALATAALAAHAPRTVLVVLAHPGDVDFWSEDLHSFAGRRAVVFPAWGTWPPREAVLAQVAGQR